MGSLEQDLRLLDIWEDVHHSGEGERTVDERGLSVLGFSSLGRSAASPCCVEHGLMCSRACSVPRLLHSEGGWEQPVPMMAWKGGLQS